ncbi:hypothetical protein VTN77DRAFT_716 [Rasamsonia byssochlamydoides]|uniref:uncharacterized protein n=1 Tax=Rasamsonia byssochlamydoides TaxID=89139 RepID=UPI003743C582
MKRFLRAFDREEKGYPPERVAAAGVQGVHSGENTSYSPANANAGYDDHVHRIRQLLQHNRESLVPADNKLLVFRALTGIDSVPALSHHGFFSRRTAPNIGIYTRVVQAEKTAALRYRAFSILINTCLSVQIVVAAALTAIGAAQGPHSVVTAFGAINTIMAGILTYLRGSGLPDREKNVEKAWGQVREYIEQREREFCLEGCELSVEEEILAVERMYEDVRQQMEASGLESHHLHGLRGIETRAGGRRSLLTGASTNRCLHETAVSSTQTQSKETTGEKHRQVASASDLTERDVD